MSPFVIHPKEGQPFNLGIASKQHFLNILLKIFLKPKNIFLIKKPFLY